MRRVRQPATRPRRVSVSRVQGEGAQVTRRVVPAPKAGRHERVEGASNRTGYRITPILDARAEAALGVLQQVWGDCSIATVVRRCVTERAAREAPTALLAATAEVAARRHAVAAKRRA